MATIWRADRMAEPGQREMRGFGARVFFYNDKSQPVPVEGDLTVHGYVTTPSSRKEPKDQPDQKFNYSAEQLSSQYSPSDLGASYSIWVPWDEDGYREEITLIATFKSKKGSVVQASPTKIFLPGKSRVPDEQMPPVTQQVSYKKSASQAYDLGPAPEKLPSTRITTIELPSKSRLNQPNLGLPAQNNYNSGSQSNGQAVEVGGKTALGSTNAVGSNHEMLPPPGQANFTNGPAFGMNSNANLAQQPAYNMPNNYPATNSTQAGFQQPTAFSAGVNPNNSGLPNGNWVGSGPQYNATFGR